MISKRKEMTRIVWMVTSFVEEHQHCIHMSYLSWFLKYLHFVFLQKDWEAKPFHCMKRRKMDALC